MVPWYFLWHPVDHVDIKLTNPGNSYQFPPFVEVVDNCKQGFGATARATVKDGKISSICIVTEGENYPVSDQPELAIVDVNIINPGQNYVDGDTVTDNFGNEYDVKIQNGASGDMVALHKGGYSGGVSDAKAELQVEAKQRAALVSVSSGGTSDPSNVQVRSMTELLHG